MSVFGALNRFISRLDDAPRPKSPDGDTSFGFQVLRNKSQEAPLEPWFDFIVGINGRPIDNPDPNLFANEVRNCSGTSVALTVWNAKGQRVRDLYLSIPSPSPTVGLTLQWTALNSTASIWHILEVAANSPADAAGLLPYGDYIIGSPEGVLRGEAGLGELVEEFMGRPLRLYVYNHEYDVVRTLTLTPARGWGGEGALGCVLGFGHLHQLPAPLEEGPPTAAGETMFESAKVGGNSNAPAMGQPGRVTPPPPSGRPPRYGQAPGDDLADFAMSPPKGDSGAYQPGTGGPPPQSSNPNFVTPADMLTASSGPPPAAAASSATATGRKANRGGNRPRAAGFDEMFAEGEKKSAEVDNAPKTKAGTGLPPPPPKARSPAPPPAPSLQPPPLSAGSSGSGTPRPETRSPDPITEEDDE